MSRDVVTIALDGSAERARGLLIAHNIRTLPVVDGAGRLAGTLGLRELTLHSEEGITQVMSEAQTTGPDEPVVALASSLTDGRTQMPTRGSASPPLLALIVQTLDAAASP
ncbi:CBS domain-containing protein [Methylorubrum rhodesianum]|uniref:CBS domain-containing protein n=1 Tax=Methylorubrum rhodesianum TaxID=29427 RepID=UPI003D15BD4D